MVDFAACSLHHCSDFVRLRQRNAQIAYFWTLYVRVNIKSTSQP
jgi:hypothetical protein